VFSSSILASDPTFSFSEAPNLFDNDSLSIVSAATINTVMAHQTSPAATFTDTELGNWTNAVPHLAPGVAADPDSDHDDTAEDLMVPFPALGAGWLLLMGGALCKLGSRVIRPN
jgi:hypothetical protein